MENNSPADNQQIPIQAKASTNPEQVIIQQKKSKLFLWIILAIVLILIIVCSGIYLLQTRKQTIHSAKNVSSSLPQLSSPLIQVQVPYSLSPSIKTPYINSTLGFKLVLPKGWTICDISTGETGSIGIDPPLPSQFGDPCSSGDIYALTTAKYFQYVSSAVPTANVTRRQGESFLDYVQRLNQITAWPPVPTGTSTGGSQTNPFIGIDAHTILQKITSGGPGSPSQRLFIEDPQAIAYIIDDHSGVTGNDPNFQIISSGLTDIPITTGDITGQIDYESSTIINGINTQHSTGEAINLPITLYANDKKTVVARTTTNNPSGYYNLRIKPGSYYFYFPGEQQEEHITVSLGEVQFNPASIITVTTPTSSPEPTVLLSPTTPLNQ